MQNKNKLLFYTLILSLIFIAGCGESVKVFPNYIEEYIGKEFGVQISYSKWFSPFKNIKIVSQCNEVEVISDTINSSKSGTIDVKLKIKEPFSQPKKCLYFQSDTYNKIIDLIITPKKQATIGVAKYEANPTYGKNYDVALNINVNKRDEKHIFVIRFDTTSSKIFSGDKDINSYTIEKASEVDNALLTPHFNIRIEDTGDKSRNVELNIYLLEKFSDDTYTVDSTKLSFNAHR